MLTEEYARRIGADFYGKDAMSDVRYADGVTRTGVTPQRAPEPLPGPAFSAGVRRFGMLKKWNWSKAAYFQLLFGDGDVIL